MWCFAVCVVRIQFLFARYLQCLQQSYNFIFSTKTAKSCLWWQDGDDERSPQLSAHHHKHENHLQHHHFIHSISLFIIVAFRECVKTPKGWSTCILLEVCWFANPHYRNQCSGRHHSRLKLDGWMFERSGWYLRGVWMVFEQCLEGW